MKTFDINISKSAVYNEVKKLSAYVGAKTKGKEDKNIYDTVFVTNDDDVMLERFWRESTSRISDELKRFIAGVTPVSYDESVDLSEQYSIKVSVPDTFDMNLTPAINDQIFSFFSNNIVYKWFAISNRGDSEYYLNESINNLNEIKKKLFHRTNPLKI